MDDERLSQGLPCEGCVEGVPGGGLASICQALREKGRLDPFCLTEGRLAAFGELFEKALGSGPWSLQRTWAKRVLLGRSFAIVAPTGVGKTTFGLLMALFLEGKALIIAPTRLLAEQMAKRLEVLAQNGEVPKTVLLYRPSQAIRRALEEGQFDILVGTNMFFHKKGEELLKHQFKLIFLDDVDSFLKRSKNVDLLFRLLGYSSGEIERAMRGERVNRPCQTVLVVSSATLRPRGRRAELFRNLLGFDVQQARTTLREVFDVAALTRDPIEVVEQLLPLLGKGGLLFLPLQQGREGVEELVKRLRGKGFKVIDPTSLSEGELVTQLEEGDFHVAVGLCHLGNPLVRGLDLPHVIRYALFLGVPRHEMVLSPSLEPSNLHNMLLLFLQVLEGEDRREAVRWISTLRKYLGMKEEAVERYPKLKAKLESAREFLLELIERGEVIDRLRERDDLFFEEEGGRWRVAVGDAAAYLQASGRTSRLLKGRMTKGLSLLFYEDLRLFKNLKRRLSTQYFSQEVEFGELLLDHPPRVRMGAEEKTLVEILDEVDRSRTPIQEPHPKDPIKTTLVVVESPNKAKTIAGFLGKPQVRMVAGALLYEIPAEDRVITIASSLGHLFDLTTRDGIFGVLEDRGGYLPVYDTIKVSKEGHQSTEAEGPDVLMDKGEIVKALQEIGYEVEEVLVATDPDTEGEKIAYDIFNHLRPFNPKVRRAEFHEVTLREFRKALKAPRDFDRALVKAQLLRRVLDRWVGFALSRSLWKAFGKRYLSAGRVQTPVLGWVIERHLEARKRKGVVRFELGGHPFQVELEDTKAAKRLYEVLQELSWAIEEVREGERQPPPPFTTDTMLHEATERLKLRASEVMSLLQELFERGLITYHRTDSPRVSEVGRYNVARPFIRERFGEEYFHPRGWGEGGAHEGIRPTRPLSPEDLGLMVESGMISLQGGRRSLRLYDLIFRRFMASQMRSAVVREATLSFSTPVHRWSDKALIGVVRDGFNLIMPFKIMQTEGAAVEERRFFTVPKVPLFSEGTLIQEMKKRGLGRPSTYATIVETLLERGYVVERRGKLIPTRIGREVFEYLQRHFPAYAGEDLTRRLEQAMEQVERGEIDLQEVLKDVKRDLEGQLLAEEGEWGVSGGGVRSL